MNQDRVDVQKLGQLRKQPPWKELKHTFFQQTKRDLKAFLASTVQCGLKSRDFVTTATGN